MLSHLKELYNFRELLWAFVLRDIKVRYRQTIFCILWAVIQPLSLMVVFNVIFTNFTNLNTSGFPYPVFAYIALVPWTLFSNSLSQAVPSLVNNASLVDKVYFPREVLPLSSFFSSFFDFIIASVIFFFMLLYFHINLTPVALLSVVMLASLTLLSWGLILFMSAIFVFFRDTKYILTLIVQLWLYVTPIIYPASLVPDKFQRIYYLNPLVSIIEGLRQTVLYSRIPPMNMILYPLISGLVLCVLAYIFFKRCEVMFSDFI